jgi:hypothetical protein
LLGKDVPFKTTLTTIDERQKGFKKDELSALFRDAIELTRRYGLRYLWIDALCIIQDSPDDWNQESSKMHRIYSDACLNISAAVSTGSSVGIFESSDRSRLLLEPPLAIPGFSRKENSEGWIFYQFCDPAQNLETSNIVQRRAWVWQESELTPRRIDYASKLRWVCRTTSHTEFNPTGDAYDPFSGGNHNFYGEVSTHYDPFRNIGLLNLDVSLPLSYWYNGLDRFRRRKITYLQDRLPAIAGVAKIVQQRTHYNYKAGLWLEEIHRGLLWISTVLGQRPSTTRAPSWSWRL